MQPRLHLLGSPKLESGGSITDLPLDRPLSLAYYLLLRGDWVRRSELVYLYYPDTEEAQAQSNFRKLIHRLKAHTWAASLETEQTRLRLLLPNDIADFRQALAQKNLPRALALYSGGFLSGVAFPELAGFEAWLELERQDLARAWRTAVFEQTKTLAAAQQYAEAEACLLPVLRLDPLDEEAVQAHLRLLHQAGETARAAAVFETFQLELARELGAKPLPETAALAQQATPTLRQSSLPASSTRFVGRRTELADLQKFLQQPSERLITLLGLGGAGKTRLALELARQMLEQYPDGVWFVSLVGVANPEQLLPSLGAVLGIGSADVLEFLHDKTMLVIFDNFEHLLGGAGKLEELLEGAAGVQLLVTSRSALNLRSERLIDVAGLAYPLTLPDSHVERFEAVSLFLEIAERANGQLERTPENLLAAAQISRKVQGLPLALELAATWVRGLGLPEIAQKLEQNLDLLASPYQNIPERQRSMQTVFAYSWQRLSRLEQEVLLGLAIFEDGFTLSAAEAVAGAHLPLLLGLMNHALVSRDTQKRFVIHELTRQFVQAQPAKHAAEIIGRYTDYYADFLVQQFHSRLEPNSPYRQKLFAEINNIFKAWELLLQHQHFDSLVQSIDALDNFLTYSINTQNVYDFYRRTLETTQKSLVQTREKQLFLAKVLRHYGSAVYKFGLDGANEFFEASIQIFKQLELPFELAVSLDSQAQLLIFTGQLQTALELLTQSETIQVQSGDYSNLGFTKNHFGLVYYFLGDIARAKAYFLSSIEVFSQHGSSNDIALPKLNYAEMLFWDSEFEKARALLFEALQVFQDNRNYQHINSVYESLGLSYMLERQYSKAVEILSTAIQFEQDTACPFLQLNYKRLGMAYRETQNHLQAVQILLECLQKMKRRNTSENPAERLDTLLELAYTLGEMGQSDLTGRILEFCVAQSAEPMFADMQRYLCAGSTANRLELASGIEASILEFLVLM